VTREAGGLETLPRGATVGTSSPRRRAIALSLRPDLSVGPIRGQRRHAAGQAADGRVGRRAARRGRAARSASSPVTRRRWRPRSSCPRWGRACSACRAADDAATLAALRPLDHAATRACALAERAFLARLGASCVTPMAAHASLANGRVVVHGLSRARTGARSCASAARAWPARPRRSAAAWRRRCLRAAPRGWRRCGRRR